MTYNGYDKSPFSGIPVEFFDFTGALRNYRYCNQAREEILQGVTYEPLQIARSSLEVGSIIDDQPPVVINVPADCDLAKDYGGERTPMSLGLTVYRAYRGDNWATQFKRKYRGKVTNYGYDGPTFKIEFNNLLQTELATEQNAIYYQTLCNHRLYDTRCKVSQAANTTVSTIVAFSDQAVEVANDGVADHALRIGTLINVRTGEERLIYNNLANVIDIGYPFLDIQIGDQVQMIKGCNHGSSDCITKFDNYPNYGGFLHIPDVNPFENGT